jgi:hypothetical protein
MLRSRRRPEQKDAVNDDTKQSDASSRAASSRSNEKRAPRASRAKPAAKARGGRLFKV